MSIFLLVLEFATSLSLVFTRPSYYGTCVDQVLLGSNLIKTHSEERSLLKNLGSWLGKLTIRRNQALRAREIDPKSLIIRVMLIFWTVFLDLLLLCCSEIHVYYEFVLNKI